ncbi:hypothetical protein D7X48_05175 [bacterium D16-50]|jgi:hypothetical protein|nr:hypothetical protein [Lachnospiraceae bacterium]RKJ21347.1 hypothetical protein D7X48_05175 [bacterium D16-50]
MAKKFGKVLLLTAAAGTAAAAVFYFLRKKEHSLHVADEDDYDDFSDALEDEDTRSYVPLNTETAQAAGTDDAPAQEVTEEAGEKGVFTPLTEQVAQTMEKAEETVEEFFDEDDDSKQETPINDN